MKQWTLSALAALVVAVGGCTATVPMESADRDAAGKRFEPPAPGRAAVYVYREGSFGLTVLVAASLGQQPLGALGADTWFRLDVEPGTLSLRCSTPETSQLLQLGVGPDEIRFVEIAVRLGTLAPRCAIFEVSAEQGRKAVSHGLRAVPQ